MRFYTLSESAEHGLSAVCARIRLLLLLRGVALAIGLGFAVILPLIDLLSEGAVDLASRSFGAFVLGEGLGLACAMSAIRFFPVTTLLHSVVSLGWIYALWRFGAPVWCEVWLGIGLPA